MRRHHVRRGRQRYSYIPRGSVTEALIRSLSIEVARLRAQLEARK